ncbi:MAG: hypothetical protein KA715_11205 [Xanthomonadaceae bacterium]|nr:hypothetical protein [Xanthomonadaceae bacterium]
MKLYMVHCGFYDLDLCDGVYESHLNLFVTGTSYEDARVRARLLPEFKNKKLHVDGVVEIQAVQGSRISVSEDSALNGQSLLISQRHRDLAPKPTTEV